MFLVFTYTVLHGGNRLNMKEGLELDCFFLIRSFQAVPETTKNTKTCFLMKNYVIITSRFVKNNIATEFPVVDLV